MPSKSDYKASVTIWGKDFELEPIEIRICLSCAKKPCVDVDGKWRCPDCGIVAASLQQYVPLDTANQQVQGLIETFRTVIALSYPNPEALKESLAYRVAELEQRLKAIRGLAVRDLAPYGPTEQSAPICGAFPWKHTEDVPHLLCAQPRGHRGDHRSGDGLTWPRHEEPRLTGLPPAKEETI